MSDRQIVAYLPHMWRTGDVRLNQYLAAIYERGFSLRAIADVVGCSYETVRKRLLYAAQEQSAGFIADLSDLPQPTILPKKRHKYGPYHMSDEVKVMLFTANKAAQEYRRGRDPQVVHAFNFLVRDLIASGVPFNAIADACDQDVRHLKRRMSRWDMYPSRGQRKQMKRTILQEVVIPEPPPPVVDDGPWRAVGVPCKWPGCPSLTKEGPCIHL